MTSTIGSVATSTIVAKGWRSAKYVYGDIATAAPPGTAFARTAINNVYTLASTAHTLQTLFYLEFRYRTSSTFGEVDIDTNDSITANCKLLDPNASGDDLEWWAWTEDMSADKWAGTPLVAHSAGHLELGSGNIMSSGTIQCRVAPNYRYVSGDTVVKVCKA